MSVSATIPDWTREAPRRAWDPGRKLVRSVRAYTDASGVLTRKLAALRHRFWSAVTSAELPLTGFLGGGLLLPHPAGIVIHPAAVLGPNCLIMQNVTIGSNGKGGLPRLGGHVDVGPGAAILGGVTIGDHAVIGANAVVLRDVPMGGVAVGVPAKVVRVRDTTAQDI